MTDRLEDTGLLSREYASLLRGARVLVADDCLVTQAMLTASLEEWGVKVVAATDGQQALDVLSSPDPPRLALLDWMMPGFSGPEICRRVRSQKDDNYVYMLLLTSMGDKEHLIEGLKSGADDYLFKPFDPDELKLRLQAGARVVALQTELEKKTAIIQEKNEALEKHNRFVRDVFGRFVTDEVAEQLLDTPEGLRLGGEMRTVTVMMSDLRNFTPMSDKLNPDQVVALLNVYLSKMVDVIMKYGGTIDEFIGDAILVIFGAPITEGPEKDAARALACAVEMQLAMEEVNQMVAEFGLKEKGIDELGMGIGLNTGEVVVGNIGSEKRMKFSVVGSPVNLTARIESFTLAGQILISGTTLEALSGRVRVDGRLRVKVKGLSHAVSIYEVGGIGEPYNLYMPEVEYRV
ncbi:MAG: response regulator [Candidatus Eremiobacteraeota bacterium]|nr:response regulator [Candidatus Eremiobacteraeota bacterium]